ncbi:MAG: aminopeptidase [Lachnospiraceae bacterium]|nr:aminopeptidase [Lachnospiraceae bacterium]
MSDEEVVFERWLLATTRLMEIKSELAGGKSPLPEAFAGYFEKCASFMLMIGDTWEAIAQGGLEKSTLEQLSEHNAMLYEDVTEKNYAQSFANPEYAVSKLGEEFGSMLSALYYELRRSIGYAYEEDQEELVKRAELLLEVYGIFMSTLDEAAEGGQYKLPESAEVKDTLYWYFSDYADVSNEKRIRAMVSPEADRYVKIVKDIKDYSDVRYLYKYGFYIGENEIETAKFIASLPEETIATMADTYTEGYRIGFEMTGKDLSIKTGAEVLYPLGFERMIAKAMDNLEKMGLKPLIRRNRLFGGEVNRQLNYDHKDDRALYFDRNFINRDLEATQTAFEKYKIEAKGYAGPAVVESFGEKDFDPVIKKEAIHMSDDQNKLYVEYITKLGQIQRKYIIEEERSFTIIAFPVPEIRECLPDKSLEGYAKFFEEIIKVNTLDYKLYQGIQQKIIDVLDKAEYVEVTGRGENKTDLRVHVWKLDDPSKQTKFENCVADVNIPVGEVFTSPVLKGTNGKLHVSRVFLNGLEFRNLEIDFKDGMIEKSSCSNYKTEKENNDYISENILFRHKTLPIGEFAIGTNTTAYTVARKYGVEGKLPILIAEKTGPHFAVGDTCYSHAEDIKVYNPDKKEIVSRTNEVAELRHTDPAKAYFNCHTDITIPYDELGDIVAVSEDGERTYIIKEGRFVVPGSEKLNEALD